MKKTFLVMAFGVMSLGLSAVQAADFKIGIVDFQQALNGVEEGKAAKEKLKKEFEGKQKDIEKRKKELEDMQEKLTKLQQQAQSGLLKPEAMAEGQKMEAEFRKKLETYTALVQESQQDISKKEMEATQGILNRLRDLIVDVGRKEEFNLVLEKNESGLLYASSYTDLTEKVIQEYNKKFKKK